MPVMLRFKSLVIRRVMLFIWERENAPRSEENQKVVEIAPAPNFPTALRDKILKSAVTFAQQQSYKSLGTFEFLVDGNEPDSQFVFIEANARLQVEHTVTEEVTGVDLVSSQIQVALGRSLSEIGLDAADISVARGYAIQARLNLETIKADGSVMPSSGKTHSL